MSAQWVASSRTGLSYPVSPWPLDGSLWLSLFRLREAADGHPRGLYGAAFVSYEEPSPLTYAELLVARLAGPRVRISDIWVDSPESMAGGRELWAIPKGLADFERDSVRRGPLESTGWTARVGRVPVARARFRDASRLAVRTPYRAAIDQPGLPDTGGEPRRSAMVGTARTLPATARWELNADGPLGWLVGARQLGSFRLLDFRMAFG
jgi:hypothetical protein